MPFKNALRFRAKQIDDVSYIEFRITTHNAFSISSGDFSYLLFDDDVSLKIECVRGGMANYEGDYWYGDYLFKISDEIYEKVKTNYLTAARINMNTGYVTFEKVKEKNAIKFRKAIEMVE